MVRHEITLFSTFLHIIKENFTKDEVSQHTKHDLQKILAWFTIDYFTHNIDLISQARKNSDLKIQTMIPPSQNSQTTFGTPNGLIMHS